MQEPVTFDITVFQGATWDLSLSWTVDDPPGPVDLTGWSAAMQIRPTAGSDDVVVELTTGNGRIVLGGEAGTVALSMEADATELLQPGAYVYDLELYAGQGGQVTRLLQGGVLVDAEVTRWLS